MPEEEFETKVASGRDKIKDAVKSAHVSNNSGENEWYTPLIYIDSARKVMKTIDLDPASSETANKNVKAKNYNTEKINGLDMDWTGNVWLNPPYSQPLIKQFSEKLLKELSHISQAIVLVNNATETNWLQPLIEKCAAACFVKGRIRFVDKNGKAGTAPLQGQVILYFGNRTVSFRTEFSKHGHILLNEI
jgi:phage N-6-adenine-methyltransferase